MKRGNITMTDNAVRLELVEGTVWVTKSEIARLLDVFVQTVSANLRELFAKSNFKNVKELDMVSEPNLFNF